VSSQLGRRDPAEPGPRVPTTSADVARLAGVSRATVSHILNGQVERFSEETAQRVRSAATALGYVPSAAGRALVTGRSDFVILVVPNVTLTNIQDIIETVAADLEYYGLNVVVHFSIPGAAGDPLARLQHIVETLRPAGLIDLGGLSQHELRLLERQGIAIISPQLDLPESVPDGNVFIARMQAEHLIERGYERLAYAFLADRRDDPYGRIRAVEVAEICAARGLAAPVNVDVPLDPEGARAALVPVLARDDGPLAFVCSNDEVALAVTFAALGLGAAVPGDVAAIGVGGNEVGQLVTPRLTTVAFDLRASMAPIRGAIAHTLSGTADPPELPSAAAFFVVQGQTT
jgi:DNA-binding LacI/PurR family transcriptional regulator